MRTTTWSKPLLTIAMVVTLLASACSSSTSDTTTTAATGNTTTTTAGADTGMDESALYEAAQDEDTMVWYCSTSAPVCQSVNDAFLAKYPGVDAEVVRLVSSDISARFAAEIEAGSPTADAIYTADYAFLIDAIEQGWTQPLAETGLPTFIDYPDEWYSTQLGSPLAAKGYSIGYNTDLVSEDEVPTSFEDLLDPKWANQIISANPSASLGILSGYGLLANHYGDELLTSLVQDQGMEFVSGGMAPTTERLGAGEAKIEFILGANIAFGAIESGAPVNYVYPEVTAGNPFGGALRAEPANPNTAKLFVNYLFSEEGENVLYANDPGAYTRWLTPDFTVLKPNIDFFTDPTQAEHVLNLLGLN